MRTIDISSNDDTIDVRDVIARFKVLRDERADLESEAVDDTSVVKSEARATLNAWDEANDAEFSTLKSLLEDLKGNGGDEQFEGDWYPVTLIRDSYFEKAMDEMLEDIGDLPKNLPCYLTIQVDYEALQMDYSSVKFEGVTYWYR